MLKSIYFISSYFHLYEVCIQGERGEYGSSLAKARFMLAPIAQPCLHPAAANHHKSGRRSRHRIDNQGRKPLPLSRAARAVRPNERAPLRGGAAKPTRGGARRSGEHRRRRAQQGGGRN